MSLIRDVLGRKTKPQPGPTLPGLYHYVREDGHEKSRIHLRLDADGYGTLIVNANRVMHLNPTAALMAFFLLEGLREHDAVVAIRNRYRVSPAQARSDLQTINSQLSE